MDVPAKRESGASEIDKKGLTELSSGDTLAIRAEDSLEIDRIFLGTIAQEQLKIAIQRSKDAIAAAPPHTDAYNDEVKKLIHLKTEQMMLLNESKGGHKLVEAGIKVSFGHKFETNTGQYNYCDVCGVMMRGVHGCGYRCKECGYGVHEKCFNDVKRTCASVIVVVSPTYHWGLAPEEFTKSPDQHCAECNASLLHGSSDIRRCFYTQRFYCKKCHWNELMLIPGEVINGIFEKRKVCRAAAQFLKIMEKKPVIRLDFDGKLSVGSYRLRQVQYYRQKLCKMAKYLLTCSSALDSKLLVLLQEREHFIDNSNMYSMRDLVDTHHEILGPELEIVLNCWLTHIKGNCELCHSKGVRCQHCYAFEMNYPFDDDVVVCSHCSQVQHSSCFDKNDATCPKCGKRAESKGGDASEQAAKAN